jgi:cardiolipin synthase
MMSQDKGVFLRRPVGLCRPTSLLVRGLIEELRPAFPQQDRIEIMMENVSRWILPNLLSLARIGLALLFPWVPPGWRAGVVVAAALSDLFDGRLSRAFHTTSIVGQVLDPVADKLFVGSVLLTLVIEGKLALLEVLLLGFRDLSVLLGSVWAVIHRGWGSLRHMPPSWLGKLTTAGQLGFLLLMLVVNHSPSLIRFAEIAVVVVSVVAGIDYLCRQFPMMDNHETTELQHP